MVLGQRFNWTYGFLDKKNGKWEVELLRLSVRASVCLSHSPKVLAENLVLGSAADTTEINSAGIGATKLGSLLQDVFQTECLMELIP